MKKAGVAELKANLSRYLDQVKGGNDVIVTERGQPVAKLVPLEGASKEESRRERQIREGILIPGRGKIRAELLEPP
jgi:prevent-host-death family protein